MEKHQSLHSNRSTIQNCTHPSSPEFEFWNMVRNPSLPQPNILSADQLFVDGFLLPLHLLPAPTPLSTESHNPVSTSPEITSPDIPSGSRRWKDMFKISTDSKTESTSSNSNSKTPKKRERKSHSGVRSAELNINIWPFSRSRSAGNNNSRTKISISRKVSSAPCSRSNSGGESKSRKWPSSPARPGVHVGRSSPVWQMRHRAGVSTSTSTSTTVPRSVMGSNGLESSKTKVVKGCKQGGDVVAAELGGGGLSRKGSGGSNLFSLRGLFSKKIY